jgi:hypothetical protein
MKSEALLGIDDSQVLTFRNELQVPPRAYDNDQNKFRSEVQVLLNNT